MRARLEEIRMASAERKAYLREYYRRNKARILACHKRSIARNPERYKAYRNKWVKNNRAKVTQWARNYFRRHPDRSAQSTKKWREANPEKVKDGNRRAIAREQKRREQDPSHRQAVNAYNREWRVKNPEAWGKIIARRLSRKKAARFIARMLRPVKRIPLCAACREIVSSPKVLVCSGCLGVAHWLIGGRRSPTREQVSQVLPQLTESTRRQFQWLKETSNRISRARKLSNQPALRARGRSQSTALEQRFM